MSGENKPEVEYLDSESTKGMPFSEAVTSREHALFVRAVGKGRSGKMVPGGIVPETKQTMENIKATLERYGSSLDHVIKVTVMLADISEWPAMNEVYAGYFSKHLPARSALGANGLALGARVEIEVIAVLK